MTGHDYAGSFKVSDAMSTGVAEMNGFLQHQKQAMGVLLEEAADRRGVIHDKIVGSAAFGAGQLAIERGVKGAFGKLANRVMAGANGGDGQRHCLRISRRASWPALRVDDV